MESIINTVKSMFKSEGISERLTGLAGPFSGTYILYTDLTIFLIYMYNPVIG